MFESLSDKLQSVFKTLSGQSRLTENNITEAMTQVREALLEADVNVDVVTDFIEEIKNECVGQDVLKTVTPGQQVIKIVHDKIVELLGSSNVPLEIGVRHPSVIMMVGLHGSGKTTSSAKLATYIRKNLNKRVLMVAADIYRPAAIDQLEVLGKEIGIPVFSDRTATDVAQLALQAIAKAKQDGIETVIIDTAGRLQIDQQMVLELVRIREAVTPSEILLVADSALGQQAAAVAKSFHKNLNLTGVILTKLDGDARGGAALSIRKVSGAPIKFVGIGEKNGDLDAFYPDRMTSRILGMGDIVSLVEKAAEEVDAKEMEKLQKKLRKNQFDYNDFMGQLRQMKKIGGLESILKMLPGGNKLLSGQAVDLKQFTRFEAMISSMTPEERENPDLIDFSRRKRIAKGSGTTIENIAQFTKQFNTMRKMMKGANPLSQMMSGQNDGFRPPTVRGSNYTPPKKKRKKH